MTIESRQIGALLGLAIGDALGAAVEFQRRGSFAPVTGYRAGGPHDLAAGEWTDDTSMALALADSIATVGWDLNDQAARYLDWWSHGTYSVTGELFDIGNTTQQAIARFEQTRDAQTSGSTDSRSSGNGSIMRLAPVAIAYAWMYPGQLSELFKRFDESSLPTHASVECRSACVCLGVILVGLMHGVPREEVLSADWPPMSEALRRTGMHPEIAAVIRGSYRNKTAEAIRGSGYVVRSLEAALWSFHDARDFQSAVLTAVNLGDDADTTGAIVGQLAGAHWGVAEIPQKLLDGLAERETIEGAARRLIAVSAEK